MSKHFFLWTICVAISILLGATGAMAQIGTVPGSPKPYLFCHSDEDVVIPNSEEEHACLVGCFNEDAEAERAREYWCEQNVNEDMCDIALDLFNYGLCRMRCCPPVRIWPWPQEQGDPGIASITIPSIGDPPLSSYILTLPLIN